MHLALSPVTLLPFLGLGLPIVFVTRSVLRGRGNNGGSGGGRHSGGGQPDSRLAAVPDPRFAAAPDPRFAPAQDPRFAYQPDPRFGGADTGFPPVAAAATAVLASSGSVQSGGATSTSGDPFPTTGRALALVGGNALAALGILVLLLSATPTGHHASHIGNGSVGFLGLLCMMVGFSFSTMATARVQRDVMGGGWNSWYSLRYISPQIALYVLSPSGISAAANRLNIAPVLAMLVVYGLLASDVLLMAAHYFGR